MEILYIVIAVAVVAAAYFLFFRKPEEPSLPRAKETEKLPEKKKPSKAETTERAERKEAATAQRKASAKEERAETAEEAPSAPEAAEAPAEEPEPARQSLPESRDIMSLRRGLAKARGAEGIFGKLKALFTGSGEVRPEIAEEIEEILLASDVGVSTTEALLGRVKESLSRTDLLDSDRVWSTLREEARRILDVQGRAGAFALRAKPMVVLMVGVNGAGKTTTIGKLATKFREQGLTCVLAAADTFRAAAVQQLIVWGDRVGCQVVRGKDGADPGSVVFDAIKKAEELGADIVLADTAGRLHTKANLMSEMKKIATTAAKAMDGAPHETLLVVDATTGQNALAQAKEFQTLNLTGLVLTKLDGTAKGGFVLGISDTLGLPVRFVGLGERPDDLHDFSPAAFVEALLGAESDADAA